MKIFNYNGLHLMAKTVFNCIEPTTTPNSNYYNRKLNLLEKNDTSPTVFTY